MTDKIQTMDGRQAIEHMTVTAKDGYQYLIALFPFSHQPNGHYLVTVSPNDESNPYYGYFNQMESEFSEYNDGYLNLIAAQTGMVSREFYLDVGILDVEFNYADGGWQFVWRMKDGSYQFVKQGE